MKMNWRKILLMVGLAAVVAVPFFAKAEMANVNANISVDNEAHFPFKDRTIKHHPGMLKAALELAEVKKQLWYAKGDFGGNREGAIASINGALDSIRRADDHVNGR
jgi:hypothetical protein